MLALLLGRFGVHRFYLGQIVLGFVYLIFCWTFIPGMISFINGILFLAKPKKELDLNTVTETHLHCVQQLKILQ